MEPEKIVQVLDELAQQARNEESVYRVALAEADGLALTAFTVSRAVQCRARAKQLEGIALLYRHGRKPIGHPFVPFLRAGKWLSTLGQRRDDMEIVELCNRQNDAALRAYESALRLPLPGTLRKALNNQLATISDCYRGLLCLRRQLGQRAEHAKTVAMQASLQASGT